MKIPCDKVHSLGNIDKAMPYRRPPSEVVTPFFQRWAVAVQRIPFITWIFKSQRSTAQRMSDQPFEALASMMLLNTPAAVTAAPAPGPVIRYGKVFPPTPWQTS